MFIRSLTESLSNFSILYKENSYKLETETFQKFCIPVLQRYIDSNEDHQLECLYAMQLLVHSLEHPRGIKIKYKVDIHVRVNQILTFYRITQRTIWRTV